MSTAQVSPELKSATTELHINDLSTENEEVLNNLADVSKAWEYRENMMIKKKVDGDYVTPKPFSVTENDYGQYGIGLELYFLTLKQFMLLFFVMACISAWPIYENYVGMGLPDDDRGQIWNAVSLANQHRLIITDSEEDNSDAINSSKIRIIIADFLSNVIFSIFIIYFSIKTDERIKANIKNNISCSDYAVEVKGLPKDNISALEIKRFFEEKFGKTEEVYLARRYEGKLKIFARRAELEKKLNHEIAIDHLRNQDNSKKIEKIRHEIKKFDITIGKFTTGSRKHDDLPIERAFIIFSLQSSREKCLKEFKLANKACKNYNDELFFDNHKLKVVAPSDPSNINWENLEYSHCKRFLRKTISYSLALGVIIISIGIIYYLRQINEGLPKDEVCFTQHDKNPDCTLSQAERYYESDLEIYCYCKYESLSKILADADIYKFCRTYMEKRSFALMARFCSCLGVALINYVIRIIFKYLSIFEKVESISKERENLMMKVFAGTFINTSLIILLVNFDFESIGFNEQFPLREYAFNGKFVDFTRDWYTKVGCLLAITMIISVFSPHIGNIAFFYPLGVCKRRFCLKRCITQRELNARFTPTDFDIATRYSQLLNILYSSVILSSGMPLLNVTAWLTITFLFLTDKFLIVKHYAKPPRYSYELNGKFIALLPFAAAMHCVVSIYMIGSTDIFPENSSESKKEQLVRDNTFFDRLLSVNGIMNMANICVIFFAYFYTNCYCYNYRKKISKILPESAIEEKTFKDEKKDIQAQGGLTKYNPRFNDKYKDLIMNLNHAAEMTRRKSTIIDKSRNIDNLNFRSSETLGANKEGRAFRKSDTYRSIDTLREDESPRGLKSKTIDVYSYNPNKNSN
ncbi:hypothetical protein SteCoe_23756 [Stentor coeruleus]|uniref:CSC1/OSCA1-like cytosolic domain-containing protein n=1 Tax=Stentor coeruleus TaxID=5963 RepID=A0A1R2BJ84_9CILI|nr:hypothetical protein SteCoe_23756 [Stentor coeruleus]